MALDDSFKWLNLYNPSLWGLLVLTYVCAVGSYRLYFSPLSNFPGPKVAALTSWYAGYHDLVRGGQYVFIVDEMHMKYGPIVRIRPDALHINDPGFIDTLYTLSPKHRRERNWTVLQSFQAPGSMLGTRNHELHRKRRAVLSSYFSQQSMRRLEPVISQTLANLLRRMDDWAREEAPVRMNIAFRAATKDIVQTYAFGEGEMCLEMEDLNAGFFDVLAPHPVIHLATHAYWLWVPMLNAPPVIMKKLFPNIATFATWFEEITAQIEQARHAKDLPEGKTIFHEIMRSDMPASEKATERLRDEAKVLVLAGYETTASTLSAIMYHLLSDRALLARLKAELETAIPNPSELPAESQLDGLPFLNALIQETLRLYPGATHRQDRVAPDEDLAYTSPDGRTYVIPAGTAMGMAASIINRHPDLYDDPDEFRPDRYIENQKLLKYLMSFSRGGRQCIGINLAYQQLRLLTAGIFRRYNMYNAARKEQGGPTLELYRTGRRDVAMFADYFNIATHPDSQGVRVIIRQ